MARRRRRRSSGRRTHAVKSHLRRVPGTNRKVRVKAHRSK